MKFKKLEINGFKSFSEKATFLNIAGTCLNDVAALVMV